MLKNVLSRLKTNIFGGPGNTNSSTSPPSKVQDINMTKTPVSSIDSDPMSFGTYQFPKDVFENQQLGHYMVFYVNLQDGAKYGYGSRKFIPVEDFHEPTGLQSEQARLKIKRNKTTGGNLSSKQSGSEDLSESGRNSAALQGLGAVRKTTTRIKDNKISVK